MCNIAFSQVSNICVRVPKDAQVYQPKKKQRATFRWSSLVPSEMKFFCRCSPSGISCFTPKSDQFQISPAASSEILHHTVWRTRLFIDYSDERWLRCQFSLHYLYIYLYKVGRMYFLNLGVKRWMVDTQARLNEVCRPPFFLFRDFLNPS